MKIKIREIQGKWSVCIHQTGVRGYKGFPHFVSQPSAQATAEGIRFCFSKIGIFIPADYSKEEPVIPQSEAGKEDFKNGIKIFYLKILSTNEDIFNKAVKSLLLP